MIDPKAFPRMDHELEQLVIQKFGLKKGPLELRLRKALRRAPKPVRRAAGTYIQARVQMGNPKLMRLIDTDSVQEAFKTLKQHLRAIDVADRRKGLILSVLGSVGFSLLMVTALLLIWLVRRGYL